jgi:hypothetical protein
MTLILSGTDGLSDVDGSAATPAIRGTDANTGIFFPAADTIAFAEGGVESMRINASGDLYLGATSGARGGATTRQLVKLGTGQSYVEIQSASTSSTSDALMFSDGSTGNYGLVEYNHNVDAMNFYTASSSRMRIDSAGNVGIGVTPSAWATSKAIQISPRASLFSYASTTTDVGNNLYYNGTDYKYLETAFASFYRQSGGAHSWLTAASGTAGNTITFTQAMSLDTSSNLSVAGTFTSGKGADVASTGSMTLGTGNFFDITGTTTISNIAIKPAGTVVYLKFAGTVNLQTGTIGNSGAMRLTGGATLVVTQYDVLTLISDGTNWWQVAVNNN